MLLGRNERTGMSFFDHYHCRHLCSQIHQCYYRASKSTSTPSVSTTRALSDLRLKYATLLEDHGSKVALLYRREKEIQEIQEREQALQEKIEGLQDVNEALKETLSRAEQRAVLAEREVGFQQAMLVSVLCLCSYYDTKYLIGKLYS